MSAFRISKTFRGIRPVDKDGRDGLSNPERGFRFEIGVGRLPSDPVQFRYLRDLWPFPRYRRDGVTVSQAYCYLSQFHSSAVSDEKIAALQADFDRARRDGVKFLLRFAYEFDGLKEGPTTDRILAHIRQLTPLVRDNADVIYVLQLGWIGIWGEFHNSVHGIEHDPEAVGRVVAATLEMLPPGHPTMMRRMAYRARVLGTLGADGPLTAAEAWTAALDVDDKRWKVGAREVGDSLGLERDARARARSHRAATSRGAAIDHVDRGDFAFRLEERAADLRHALCHVRRDFGLRRDRITKIMPATAAYRRLGDRLVALHQNL